MVELFNVILLSFVFLWHLEVKVSMWSLRPYICCYTIYITYQWHLVDFSKLINKKFFFFLSNPNFIFSFFLFFFFFPGDPKWNKTWIFVDFLVKSGFCHLYRVVGMGWALYRGWPGEHTIFQLPGSEFGQSVFRDRLGLQKVCSNNRTNAAPLGIVPLLFVFGSN
jgi:hypothetical protein